MTDPDPRVLILATREWSSIDVVIDALVAASRHPVRSVYVERSADLWRWSPAHKGGAYPLLRETALFLGVDHRAIFVPFRTSEGFAVINPDIAVDRTPEASGFFRFDEPASAAAIRALLEQCRPIRAAVQERPR